MKPNILLIVIDSLRYDKCYGKTKTSLTPNLDKILDNAVCFNQAISTVSTTIPSMGSILAGTFPFKIGLGGEHYDQLSVIKENYIQLLKKNGYKTYATTPSIAADFGLTCEFTNTDKSHDNYFSLFSGLGDQIINKLTSSDLKEPWFLYVHLYDLHTPVVVPKEFSTEKYGDSQYEKMVSAIDYWIGKFMKKIDEQKTLLILTSDHGEYIPIVSHKNKIINLEASIGETNLWKLGNKVPKKLYPMKKKLGSAFRITRSKFKKTKIENLPLSIYEKRVLLDSRMKDGHRLFDDLLRVPLIFSGFNLSKFFISQQVRTVDIFPTIVDLIGLSNPQKIDGQSLKLLIDGSDQAELPAYIESPPTISGSLKKVIGVRTSKYKYLRSADNTKFFYELYDLENDPLEEKNIITQFPDIVEKMEKILTEIRHGNYDNKQKMSEEKKAKIREKLRKLGYV